MQEDLLSTLLHGILNWFDAMIPVISSIILVYTGWLLRHWSK